MSYDATIVNHYDGTLTIIPMSGTVPGDAVVVNQGQTISLSDINTGDGFVVRIEAPITVRYDSTDLTRSGRTIFPQGTGDYPRYNFVGAGTYTIRKEGDNVFSGNVTVLDVVNTILNNQCGWNPYSNVLYGGPWNQAWGNNSACEYEQFGLVSGMINKLLFNKTREERVRLLNEVVVTPYLPPGSNDGTGQCTMLEATVITTWPALVAKLLTLGADPNLTTNPFGQTILTQLTIAQLDGQAMYDWYDVQAIIDSLLKAGAYVPPYFPGTYGYAQQAPWGFPFPPGGYGQYEPEMFVGKARVGSSKNPHKAKQ